MVHKNPVEGKDKEEIPEDVDIIDQLTNNFICVIPLHLRVLHFFKGRVGDNVLQIVYRNEQTRVSGKMYRFSQTLQKPPGVCLIDFISSKAVGTELCNLYAPFYI